MQKVAICAVLLSALSSCSDPKSDNGGAGSGTNGVGGALTKGGNANATSSATSALGGQVSNGGSPNSTGTNTGAGGTPADASSSQSTGGSVAEPAANAAGARLRGGNGAGGNSGGNAAGRSGTGVAGGNPLPSGGRAAAAGSGNSTGGVRAGGGASSTAAPPGGRAATGGTKASGGSTTAGGGETTTPARAGASAGCVPPPTTYPNLFVTLSGHTQEDSDAKVAKAWSSLFDPKSSGSIYHDGPGSDESYVQDHYNNDVRTEGMSYGMIAAVQLDHQTQFDRLWTWVRNHMAQNCTASGCTGEIAWSCSTGGGKNSSGGAPDGEEYMATALIFASNRWGNTGKFDYAKEAQWVLDLIRTKYFNTTYHLVKFVAGSNNTDGSYVLPSFYQVWACFDTKNADFWNLAITAGREYFHNAIDSNGVIPDQTSFDGKSTVRGAGSDTVRCVMNIMMDWNFFAADPWQKDTYAVKFGNYSKSAGGTALYPNALLGFGLPESSGKAFVDKLWSASVPNRDYWNGVLYMLAMLHVSGTFKLYY